MVQTRKYSEFPLAGAFQPGDVFVGLQNGVNVRFDSISGAGGGSVEKTVTQDTSQLSVKDWVRFDTTLNRYVRAQANNAFNANVSGLVKSIAADGLSFVLQQVGPNSTTFSGLATGDYFLSTTVAGGMQMTEPTNNGEVSVPVWAADSASTGLVRNFRGKIIGPGGGSTPNGNGTSVFTFPGTVTGAQVGDAVYSTGTNTFALADNASETTAEVVGIIVAIDAGVPNFTIQTEGWTTALSAGPLNPLTPAARYWLQNGGTSPNLATTRPTGTTFYQRPVLIAANTSTAAILQRWPLQDADGVNVRKVTQNSHGFPNGYFVRPSTASENQWVAAQADSIANATDVWMITNNNPDGDGNSFIIQQDGYTDQIPQLGGEVTGSIGYLSATAGGVAVLTEPTTNGQVSLPLYRLNDSTTNPKKGDLLNVRPMLQPGANGGGGAGKVLLQEFDATVTPELQFDFPTVFSANSQYRRYLLEWDDIYNDDAVLGGYIVKIEVYIGGVLQTTGYTVSQGNYVFGTNPSVSSSNTYVPICGGTIESVHNTLPLSYCGDLTFYAPGTNGSYKKMRGRYSGFGNNVVTTQNGIITGFMVGNTMPVQGFKISLVSGGATKLYGHYRLYGVS